MYNHLEVRERESKPKPLSMTIKVKTKEAVYHNLGENLSKKT